MIKDAYIVSCIRTPIGKAGGVFSAIRPDDLLSFILKDLLIQNPSLDPSAIDDVIIGCAMPEAEQGLNVARIASLLAGYPASAPGVTINRFCASGLQSIAYAADKIRLGEADIMIAGGVESMSMIPTMGNMPAFNIKSFADENIGMAYGMGATAEEVAKKYNISRQSQDEFSLKSHKKALAAIEAGYFDNEISPFTVYSKDYSLKDRLITENSLVVARDEGVRGDSSIGKLSKLRTVFKKAGTVTAGNTSQMSDGASAVLVCSRDALNRFNLEPLARFVGFAVSGVDPKVMGIGPVLAIPKVLKQCGIKQHEVNHMELNEAFAAQTLAVIRELDLDLATVNPLGGAIAMGHPLGATGSIRTTTLLHSLKRTGGRYGMVTMCVGMGMGAAGIFERM